MTGGFIGVRCDFVTRLSNKMHVARSQIEKPQKIHHWPGDCRKTRQTSCCFVRWFVCSVRRRARLSCGASLCRPRPAPLLMTPPCCRGPVLRLTAAHKTQRQAHTAAPVRLTNRRRPRLAERCGRRGRVFRDPLRVAPVAKNGVRVAARRYRLGRAPSVSGAG